MAASRQSQNSISTQIQLDVGDLKKDVKNLDDKVTSSNKKIDTVLESMKGYVPVEIYKLHMEAQAKVDKDQDDEIEALKKRTEVVENFININNTGIKFSNDVISNILKTIGYAAAATLILFAGYVILKNGGSL